ncbi:helix-turn-helix transcriptional regulator, partial [Corallococcus coralloides]|nr:helix-turn-helix transcriptional regulator [Corallococcus coralloides]
MGRHRQFNENEALEAALSVFWQKGYEGASLEDLTQATGVARPGLYAAFGNKEKIFLKALDLYDAAYMGFMREALDEPTSREVVARILRE